MATRAGPGHPWHLLLDALLARRVELAADISRRMAMECTVRLARADPPELSDWQTRVLEEVGEAQARLGVPVDQMLLAWRIGANTLVEHGTEEAGRLELGDRQLLNRRASFVRAVLFGTGDHREVRARAKSYGLDPGRRYLAVRARPVADGSWRDVDRVVGLAAAERSSRGMSVLVDGDAAGFQVDPPGDATPGRAGVGPAEPLDRLAESTPCATDCPGSRSSPG